ncbi:MAG: DUF998 domain-containing protein [Candidatus Bathyarchaeia archaeon]
MSIEKGAISKKWLIALIATNVVFRERVRDSREKVAGVLFFIAVTQFILGFIISEALYPGYSVSDNTISDLGIGPSSIIFNSSVFLLGFLLLIGTYFLRQIFNFKIVNTLLFFTAMGLMGIGVFTKDFIIVHSAMALIAFFFAGLSAISSYKVLKKPLSLISLVLGMMTLGALVLFISGIITSGSLTSYEVYDSNLFLGLGPGGMERMIVYPALMWFAGFSGHLVTQQVGSDVNASNQT